MSIEYFDFDGNVTEKSPKNMPRPFRPNEAFYMKDGQRQDNPSFDLEAAKLEANYAIKEARYSRYKKETDPLLLEIQAMNLRGQDPNGKIDEFKERYYKIKEELPLK
ncbi:hypothetical protein [Polynucleobacter sp.]|uniref:hypothetical protein n=1 Tax=Polynucleobacter sp. TaxID=2029855 RepID=UPI003F69E6AA